jgi:hypothetical protein
MVTASWMVVIRILDRGNKVSRRLLDNHKLAAGFTRQRPHFERTMPRSFLILSKTNPIALITVTLGLALQ